MARRTRDCAVYRLLLRQSSKCCARGRSRDLLDRVAGRFLLSSLRLLPQRRRCRSSRLGVCLRSAQAFQQVMTLLLLEEFCVLFLLLMYYIDEG